MNDEERADAPLEALRLVTPTRPHEVPAALLALPADALVYGHAAVLMHLSGCVVE